MTPTESLPSSCVEAQTDTGCKLDLNRACKAVGAEVEKAMGKVGENVVSCYDKGNSLGAELGSTESIALDDKITYLVLRDSVGQVTHLCGPAGNGGRFTYTVYDPKPLDGVGLLTLAREVKASFIGQDLSRSGRWELHPESSRHIGRWSNEDKENLW